MGSTSEKIRLRPHYEVVDEHLQSLLLLLFNNGEEEILADIANIHYSKDDPRTRYIHSLSYSSSLSEVHALILKQSRDNFHDSWIVWDKLRSAHWYWVHGEEFFQRQEQVYETTKNHIQQDFLLGHYRRYEEICAIKAKYPKSKESSFCARERFKRYLKVIMNDILLFQQELTTQSKEDNKIHALGLELDDNLLYLSVEWVKDKKGIRLRLHKFQEESTQHKTFRSCFNEADIKTLDLRNSTSGNSSRKFLERIGLVEELKLVFVEKTTTHTVTFRGKRVELNSLTSVDQTKLFQQIETLPPKR